MNAALESRGFAPTGPGYIHHHQSLEQLEQLAHPLLPNGFALRTARGVDQAHERADAHRRAFQSNRVSTESYLRLMGSVDYDPDLDHVVIETATDRTVSFALAWLDDVNKVGELEPVGTDPQFRRLGLARCACASALNRLRDHGTTQAIVNSAEGDENARNLYASLGFSAIDRNRGWRPRDQ